MSTKAALAKTLENRFKYLTSMERVYAKGTKSYEDLVVKTIEGILGTVRTCKLIKVEDGQEKVAEKATSNKVEVKS